MTVGTGRILLTRRSPTYWRVTFDLPPLNIFGPAAIPQLDEIVTALEPDGEVRVVLCDSACDGFSLTALRLHSEAGGHDANASGADRSAGASRQAGPGQPRSG